MTQFEPLREGFRELNRMMIDGMQWDAKHAQSQAANKMQEANMLFGFEQQAFNNKMAMARQTLAQRGEDRAWQQLEQQRINADRSYQLAQRNTVVSEKNQLLAADNDARLKEAHTANMVALNAKADDILFATQDAPLSFTEQIPDSVRQNPEFMKDLNAFGMTKGFSVDANGTAIGPDGEPVMMKRNRQGQFFPVIQALAAKHSNEFADKNRALDQMQQKYSEWKEQSKGSDNYNIAERARAKREMRALEPIIRETQQFFTSEGQLDYHNRKMQELAGQSNALIQYGETAMAANLTDEAKHHRNVALAIEDKMAKARAAGLDSSVDAALLTPKELYYEQLDKSGRARGAGLATWNEGTNEWNYNLPDGRTVRMKQLPKGVSLLKPTETFDPTTGKPKVAKPDKDQPGGMTENQMLDFSDIKSEGMMATTASHELDNMKETMGEVALALNKGGLDRKESHIKARSFRKEQEAEYWSEIESMKKLDASKLNTYISAGIKMITTLREKAIAEEAPISRIKFYDRHLKEFNTAIKTRNIVKARKALEIIPKIEMEEQYRMTTGNPNMVVYTPNRSTKEVTFGSGRQ